MDTFTCSVTWSGEKYDVAAASPATAALVIEAFLGPRPLLRQLGLALFTAGGRELASNEQVHPGNDLILRPRVVHLARLVSPGMGVHASRPCRRSRLAAFGRAVAVTVLAAAGFILAVTFIAILASP